MALIELRSGRAVERMQAGNTLRRANDGRVSFWQIPILRPPLPQRELLPRLRFLNRLGVKVAKTTVTDWWDAFS